MKIFSIAFVFVLLTGTFAFGQPTASAEQELIDLSTQWMDALARRDQAALERFLAEDFYVSAPGDTKKVSRGEWIKNAGQMDWRDLRFDNFKVDIYGDTAVVTSLLSFKVTSKWGIPIITNSQITDVWVKRSGQWQVAARHLGMYSLGNYLRIAAGFIAGLVLCLLVRLRLKLKRRSAAKRNPAVA